MQRAGLGSGDAIHFSVGMVGMVGSASRAARTAALLTSICGRDTLPPDAHGFARGSPPRERPARAQVKKGAEVVLICNPRAGGRWKALAGILDSEEARHVRRIVTDSVEDISQAVAGLGDDARLLRQPGRLPTASGAGLGASWVRSRARWSLS